MQSGKSEFAPLSFILNVVAHQFPANPGELDGARACDSVLTKYRVVLHFSHYTVTSFGMQKNGVYPGWLSPKTLRSPPM